MNDKVVAPGLMLFLAGVAEAVPVDIRVDFAPATLGQVTCSATSPPQLCQSVDTTPGIQGELWLTFELDRAVPGSFDVSSGLAGSLLAALEQATSVLNVPLFLTATAVVQDGLLGDLLLDTGYAVALDGLLLDFHLVGTGGGYRSLTTLTYSELGGAMVEIEHTGAYLITQPPAEPRPPGPVTPVPEPGTWLLIGSGLAALLASQRRRRAGIRCLRPTQRNPRTALG